MAQKPDPALLGRTIAGKFVVDAAIGGGAMGAVYRARHFALDKDVAIKVMHRDLSRDPAYVARFLREAKAASRIDHPCSVRVIDFGEEPDGLLYLAMELLDGRDLYTVLHDDGPMPPERICDILLQMLAAIAVAHEMGVVHRDIKPENIVVLAGTDDEGKPHDLIKVCDFGVAKITDRRGEKPAVATGPAITTEGLVVGTPEYMSPEQGRGEVLDARSDLYSVGVILYQMLAGKVPFEAESALGIVLKHVTEDPTPPSALRPNVDGALEAICLRALKKKKEERYQTAREMRAELRTALSAHGGSTAPHRSLTAAEAQAAIASRVVVGAGQEEVPQSTADTAVAFDSSAIRAVRPSVPAKSEVPESIPPPPGVRPRWGGILLGALLLALAGGVFAFLVKAKPAPDKPSPIASASARSVPSVATAMRDPSNVDVSGAPTVDEKGAAKAPDKKPRAVGTKGSAASVDVDGGAPAVAFSDGGVALAFADAGSAKWDAKQGNVTVQAVRALGVSPETLRKAVPLTTLVACYRSGLTGKGPRPVPSHMTLHLDANDDGRVNSTTLTGSPPIAKSSGTCVINAMIGKTIGGDGGALVSGDVELVFSVD